MQPLRGIVFKIMAVVLFVAMASLIKAASGEVPPGQAVFFRSLFAIPVILGWLAARGQLRHVWRTKNPLNHFWRGLVGTTAMGLGFAGLGMLPLPEVTAIGYAVPLFVVIFAAMFLGEQVRMFRLAAVALGLLGVVVILSPRLSVGADLSTRETLGAVLVLGSAFFAGLAQVYIRKLTATEETAAIVFWFSVTATVLSFVTIWWGWAWPSPGVLAMLVGAGLIGGVGQICLTTSYRLAEASLIAPFDYVSMLLAIAIGYFVFDEVPTATVLAGASLVIAAGVIIIWRERQLGLERAQQKKALPPGG